MSLKKHYFDIKNKLFLQGAFSFANSTLLSGIFLIGFALALGANNFEIGILTAIPLFANLLQLVSAFILEITGRKKKTTIVSLFFGKLVWIIIVLIAFGVIYKNSIKILMAVLIVSSCLSAIGNLSMLSWTKDIVPLRRLARFLGKKNMYASAGGIIAYIGGSYLIDKFPGLKIYGYLFISGLIIGVMGFFFLKDIPDKRKKIKAIHPKKFIRRLMMPFKDSTFKPLIYFGSLWGFAINISAPFFLVFMIDDLSLNFLTVSLILVVHTLARIYGLSIFRNIADKYGAKPSLTVAATVTSTVPLWFVFINQSNYYLLPLAFVISAFSYAAIDIATGQLLFKLAPKQYDAYYLSSFTSLTGLTSALGPILGGYLALIIKNNNLPFIIPLKYVFIISFILRTLCLPLITKIQEKKAKDVSDVIDRMRNLKFASFFVTMYSFADYTSKIVLVPQKQLFILQRKAVQRSKDLKKILKVFSNIRPVINKTHKRMTIKHEKKIIQATQELTKQVDKIDYKDIASTVPTKVLTGMESLKSSIESDDKKAIKDKTRLIKKDIDSGKEKLEKASKEEVKLSLVKGNS